MRIESGRRKIIYHDFVQGQGNPSECQRFAVHDEACRLGWITLSLYKVVVDSYNLQTFLFYWLYLSSLPHHEDHAIKILDINYSCIWRYNVCARYKSFIHIFKSFVNTSWVAVFTPTDRPKSVRNRCVIEFFCGIVCVVTLPFWHFCWCMGFCHRTESDIFIFLYMYKWLVDRYKRVVHYVKYLKIGINIWVYTGCFINSVTLLNCYQKFISNHI